jgi:PAS domain S-box-containing protein
MKKHVSTAIKRFDAQFRRQVQVAFALGSWVAYALAFIPLYHWLGIGVAALGILPVAAMGWLFGMRAGLLAGLLTFPMDMLLTTLAGGAGWDMITPVGMSGSVIILLIGAVVGRLRDMGEQVKQELIKRERVEETLRESEEKYRTVLHNIEDGYYEVDMAGNLTFFNDSLCRLYRYSEDELMGMNYRQYMDDETAKTVYQTYNTVYRTGKPTEAFDWEIIRKDGARRFVQVSVSLMRGPAGEPVGFRGIVHDITERKQAEQALRKAHDELEIRVEERTAELAEANQALRAEITERKRAEEALKDFARIQAALFQLSTDLAATLDEADVCRVVVHGMRDTLGYDYLGLFLVDEATGERVLCASDGWPDAPSDWRIAPGHGLSERPLLDGQLHYTPDVTRDPCYVPGLNSGAEVDVPLRIGEEVLGVLVVESEQPNAFNQDDFAVLTAAANQASLAIERVREHQAVKEAEARYRSLFDGVPLGLYRSTPAGQFLDANPALARMLGYPDIESLLAVNAVEVHLNVEERRQWQALLEREGIAPGWELQLRRRDGTVIWVEENAQVVRDQDGRVLHYEGSLQDITERKRAEEALHKSEALFHSLIESLPQNIFSKDLEGRFTFANQRYCMTQGKSLADILGKTDFDLHPPELAKKYQEDDRRAIETGQIIEAVEEHQPMGGERFYVQVIKTPVYDAKGQVTGILGLFWDITERKRAEEQLQRYATELEQANEELKAFAYTVSHDLRAPLVNLKGFAAELRAALAVVGSAVITALPHLDENQRPAVTTALQKDLPEALGFIDSSVTRMDSLTKALLKLSRLGRREIKLERIDMYALVQVTLQTLARQIEQRQVEVTVGALPGVVADRTSMEQIVGNLLTNAVLYLDTDRPGEIEITGERDHNETTFLVRDNGCGIAEEDMEKVFAPFRRAGGQDVPGEGMGLPYVQALVRRHGGRIWCESQPGKGSTFYFTIPTNVKGGSHV